MAPKPGMSDKFDKLLKTKSETEFFFLVAVSLPGELSRTYDETHGFSLTISMMQNLTWRRGSDRVFGQKATHVFSLFEDGTLTWTILGQPTLSGLKNIQEALEKYRDSFEQAMLPAQT